VPNPVKKLFKLNKKESYNLELLYLGQIHKAKGILELIKTVKSLNISSLRLSIVGVGPDLASKKNSS